MRYTSVSVRQIPNAMAKPGFSSAQAMKALEEVFAQKMPKEMGYDGRPRHEFPGEKGSGRDRRGSSSGSPCYAFSSSSPPCMRAGRCPSASCSYPPSPSLALAAIWPRGQASNVYAQIGLIVLIGLGEDDPDRRVCEEAGPSWGRSLTDAALGRGPFCV